MSIILKEAFRYQNLFNSLIDSATYYLASPKNYMVITEEHHRSDIVPEAKDETKDNLADRTLNVSPEIVVKFMLNLFHEKEKLSDAINTAKIKYCPEMDMIMSLNKTRYVISKVLKNMTKTKDRESIVKGTSYTFNAEGNQTQYVYDIKQTQKADFDRYAVKKESYELSKDADEISNQIDRWLSTVTVEYESPFDLNDSFEELVEGMTGEAIAS